MPSKASETPNTRLKYERIHRGWSQNMLAEQIGTSFTNVSRWERGITCPGAYFRSKLCTLFGKTLEELGLCPEVSIVASRSDISETNPHVAPLESGSDSYIGQDGLVEYIKQKLFSQSCQTIALTGLPGIGKTALVRHLSHEKDIQKQFRGKCLWVSLGPNPDICQLLREWADQLGITPPTQSNSIEAWTRLLHTHLHRNATLFIIDDVWNIRDALAFKVGGPSSRYIITTRFIRIASQFAREHVIRVPDLNVEDSLQLLTHFAPMVVEMKPAAINKLVLAIGGYPLLLTLIGEYLCQLSHYSQPRRLEQTIAHLCIDVQARLELEHPLSPLERLTYLSISSSLSVKAVMERNLQVIDRQTYSALSALSLFAPKPCTFSEEAALAISAGSTKILDILSDIGLIESCAAERYSIHPVVVDYARTYLRDPEAYNRFISYSVSFAEKHSQDFDALTQEYGMLHSAWLHIESQKRCSEKERLLQALKAYNDEIFIPT